MLRTEQEGPEDQQIERALEQRDALLVLSGRHPTEACAGLGSNVNPRRPSRRTAEEAGIADTIHSMASARQPDGAAQLEELLQRFEPPIRSLVRAARTKLRTLMPTALELVYSNRNAVAIGFASSDRRGDWIVSLATYARGVNLYFIYGVALDDPHGLLQGSGNQGRFVRLESAAMLDRPEIVALIEAAINEADTPLPTRGRGYVVIKSLSVAKSGQRRRTSVAARLRT
jgi:hypothetical protein